MPNTHLRPTSADDAVPGRILRAEPMTARLVPGWAIRARAWRVRYESTTATGEPTVVSGTILAPERLRSGAPLLGFAPGTQGLAHTAAVSRLLRYGLEYEGAFLAAALGRGWVLAVTDYPGLGTPGTHPYVVGPANGRAVLDIMRAARTSPELGLDPSGVAGVYGYSEGGNAAGWAAQLQPGYAPDVALAGVAVGGAPVDLMELSEALDTSLFAFLLIYAAIGMDASFPELRLDEFLNTRGRLAAAVMKRTHIVPAVALGLALPKTRARYLAEDLLRDPAWIARMSEASLGHLPPGAPVLIGHGRQDQVLPYRQSELLLRRWRALGADATHHRIAWGEHLTAAPQFARAGFAFLGGRFAAWERAGLAGSTAV
ncbi:triacylglycerol lipase [Nocardia puris]|uniref:Secretory lipase n=1 Tax=Nocardia puris TaxID=208602 RepID=A0A366DCQ0_9NOCA|nr:lipase family protein [Nocardia puris]MBF6211164.1 triacylglycerol lipase [Nocardia puris]MBF6364883.1 triacylglycerol lipase [Nocardia puris]MBF6458669.1 triacylglycerol lipase [Nocardia puris]RBO87832.1 secretory lipase [Nocardia puris]